ncbi:hypothetical protein ACFPOE_08705 [Caenimonas terrae]|uniref:DUF4148 domain-containing protein n=1 Tax=Caenimonas terrae TaxID=696074 RepID=A0ABW0NAR3_9BURK
MSTRSQSAVSLLTLALALAAAAIPVLARAATGQDSAFASTHPRREQVNERLASQNRRIKAKVAAGDLTGKQAAKLHRDDRNIRREERLMASQNRGHITKAEQGVLNRQENAVGSQIGR